MTKNQLKLFAEALADPENYFAISLGKSVVKMSANNEVFEHIKNTFETEMDDKVF